MRWFLLICMLALIIAPATSAAMSASAPTPTVPVVRIILYWTEGCGNCHEIIDGLLPAMQRQYGRQLEVRLIEVISLEDISAFFAVAEAYGYARGKAAAPFLLVSDRALMGVTQIRQELPGLMVTLLALGGADWPAPATETTGKITVLADDICGFTTPCADDPLAVDPMAAQVAASADRLQLSAILMAAIGLVAATGAGLAGLRRGRARERSRTGLLDHSETLKSER